jgi:hypothetical protein
MLLRLLLLVNHLTQYKVELKKSNDFYLAQHASIVFYVLLKDTI